MLWTGCRHSCPTMRDASITFSHLHASSSLPKRHGWYQSATVLSFPCTLGRHWPGRWSQLDGEPGKPSAVARRPPTEHFHKGEQVYLGITPNTVCCERHKSAQEDSILGTYRV